MIGTDLSWINARIDPPKVSSRYLVATCQEDNTYRVSMACFINYGSYCYPELAWYDDREAKRIYVEYWMPLPGAPKGED